jgi:hypothetical protein
MDSVSKSWVFMKIFFLFLISLSFFVGSFCFADEVSNSNLEASMNVENSGVSKGKQIPKEWVIFFKEYNKDRIHLLFPDDPTLQKAQNLPFGFIAEVKQEQGNFQFCAYQRLDLSKEEIFTLLQDFLKVSVDQKKGIRTGKGESIDISFEREVNKEKIPYVGKVLITDKNVYLISTSNQEGHEKETGNFLKSFSIR